MRVVHEKLAKQSGQAGERARRAFEASCEAALQGGKGSYENPLSTGAELRPLLAKAHDDLNPLRIRSLLRAIPDSELQLLDMSAVDCRPENPNPNPNPSPNPNPNPNPNPYPNPP